MPLLTYNGFGGPGHQQPNFDGFIYIHYAAPPCSARISTIYFPRWANFGWVPFAVCNAWQRSRTEIFRRVGEITGPILTRLWTKVFRRCRTHLVLSNAPAVYVTFRSEDIRH